MKVYFMGSYVNGAVNTPSRDVLFEQLEGKLPNTVEYIGAQIDKASRMYSMITQLRKNLKEADVLFLHPSRMATSYFEIGEALILKKDIYILCRPEQFAERMNYPYSLPNFKFIGLDEIFPILELTNEEELLEGLKKGALQ